MKRKQTDIQNFAMVKKSYSSTPNKEKMVREKKNAQSLNRHKHSHAGTFAYAAIAWNICCAICRGIDTKYKQVIVS